MTSLRAVLNCVHSASFEAIIANETWEFKRVRGIYLLLYCSWYYRFAEKRQINASHFLPHASAGKGIFGKGDSTTDQVSPECCLAHFVVNSCAVLY